MCDEMKSGLELQKVLDDLRKPFHPSQVTWKPGVVKGDRALALAYADLRAYMNRLDEVCGSDWSVAYEPWGEDRLICRLTIMGVTRSSTGETTNESEKNEIGGTVAEAQAFKRASAMFGLGRYLYNLPTGWADFDPVGKRFTEQAKFKLTGVLLQQYRRATDTKIEMAELFAADEEQGEVAPAKTPHEGEKVVVAPELSTLFEQFNGLGQDLYGEQWDKVCRRNVSRISGGKTQKSGELTAQQMQQLIKGMMKLKSERLPMTNPVPTENVTTKATLVPSAPVQPVMVEVAAEEATIRNADSKEAAKGNATTAKSSTSKAAAAVKAAKAEAVTA